MPTYDAFISYASADHSLVSPLVNRLRRDGFRIWFDNDDIVLGVGTASQLADAIDASRHTIACLTDTYLTRGWTRYEVAATHRDDLATEKGRLLPLVMRRLTVPLSGPLAVAASLDMTDPDRYEHTYGRLAKRLRDTATAAPPPPDVREASGIAFEHLNDPALTLIYTRQVTGRLARLVHERYVGDVPEGYTFDQVIDALLASADLPEAAATPLAVLQAFGNQAMRAGTDDIAITPRTVAPAVNVLRMLIDWVFPENRQQDTWTEIWESLPVGDGALQRRIPNSRYRLVEPQLSRNSLGPLYAGLDSETQERVSINLVNLPEDAEQGFFDDVGRFRRLNAANVMRPLDAGRVVTGGQRRCLYLVMAPVDGMSVQDLMERNGPLPERAAYELCLRVATALAGFHEEKPPIVHGDIKPASVLVGSFGTVGLLCIGQSIASVPTAALSRNADARIDSFHFASPEQRRGQPLTPMTDLYALRAVLAYLLTGKHTGGPAVATAGDVLSALSGCHSAVDCCRVLADALRDLPAERHGRTDLRSVVTAHMTPTERGLIAQPGPLTLVAAYSIASRLAWPLGDNGVLVWETGPGSLAVLHDNELVWRDGDRVSVRRAVTDGSGRRLAIGGWAGAVRGFVDGRPSMSTDLDGAVGDLRFHGDDLIVGGWKRGLRRIKADGSVRTLVPVHRGVHRIAVSERADRFAVADQSGGLIMYHADRPVETLPAVGPVADIAYAGSRLIVLTDEAVCGVRLDGSRTPPVATAGAFALGRSAEAGHCLLLVATDGGDPAGPAGPAVQAWHIDEAERRRAGFTLAVGEALLSICAAGDRLTVRRPDGGCAYRRDGDLVLAWPDALAATVSDDGRRVAVSRPHRVEVYEDPC